MYLYSRKTPSGEHLPAVLTPWPLSIRILFSLLCFFVVSLFDSNDDFLLAPAADVALGRGLGDVEAGCQLLEVLRGEHSREAGEELFFALGALGGGLGELGAGEFLVHADGVPNEDAGDGHRGGEVFVVTEEGGVKFAGVVAAAGCEGHRNAEGDETQAADAGYDIVTKEAVKFGLQGGVVVVEGMLLIRGELEFHLGHSFQVLIDAGEGPADVVEDFVEG